MRPFREIHSIAAKRKGGPKKLEAQLTLPYSPARIRKTPDGRFLAEMTKCVFQAGFSWSVIESKWAGFEAAFEGFDVARWSLMTPDDLDRLLKEDAIVRNAGKIKSVGENAAYLSGLAKEAGSVGRHFAAWKAAQYCDNLRALQKNGSRLGGRTGQTFLRRMGVDTLVFSPDVLSALKREGVIDKAPSSAKSWAALQRAIDQWTDQSSRSLNEISQILAFSVG